jgi:hypothetical protein
VLPEHSISQYVPVSQSKYSETDIESSMYDHNIDSKMSKVSEEDTSDVGYSSNEQSKLLEDPFGYRAAVTNTVDRPQSRSPFNSGNQQLYGSSYMTSQLQSLQQQPTSMNQPSSNYHTHSSNFPTHSSGLQSNLISEVDQQLLIAQMMA